MKKEDFLNAIKKLKETSKKRNFKQSYEISIALKDVDLKKPEEKISTFVVLPRGRGKKVKVCAFVDKDVLAKAREVCDKVILKDEFKNLDKKQIRKLASEYSFIAEATVMMDLAKTIGKFLAQKHKMPDPKIGGVFPPNADLKIVVDKIRNTVKLEAKKQPVINAPIGFEDQSDEDIAENAYAVYSTVLKSLPRGKQQIKRVYIKLTMSKPIMVGKNEKGN